MKNIFKNFYIKKNIFSYFVQKPDEICVTCKNICVWNKKKIIPFVKYPILDATVYITQCNHCFMIATNRDFF